LNQYKDRMESDPSISGNRNKKLSSKSQEQFKRLDVRKPNSKHSTYNPLFRSWIEIPGFNTASIVTIWIHPVFQQTLFIKQRHSISCIELCLCVFVFNIYYGIFGSNSIGSFEHADILTPAKQIYFFTGSNDKRDCQENVCLEEYGSLCKVHGCY